MLPISVSPGHFVMAHLLDTLQITQRRPALQLVHKSLEEVEAVPIVGGGRAHRGESVQPSQSVDLRMGASVAGDSCISPGFFSIGQALREHC